VSGRWPRRSSDARNGVPPRRLRLDPDPLTVEPEPVRRAPDEGPERAGMVIVWLAIAVLVTLAVAAVVLGVWS
jgi:hypothetical protein